MIDISVDPKDCFLFLDDVAERQIPFAAKNALLKTGLEVQKVVRARGREIFTLRRPDWFDKTIKITHFPTKPELWLELAVKAPGSKSGDRSDIIAKFEDQTKKESVKPGGHIAIPIKERVKRNNRDIIAARNRPSAYHFRRVGGKIVGDQGTFITPSRTRPGLLLIMQRVATGKSTDMGPALPAGWRDQQGRFTKASGITQRSNVFALYLLVPQVPIRPELHFEQQGELLVPRVWPQAFSDAFQDAMRTAR